MTLLSTLSAGLPATLGVLTDNNLLCGVWRDDDSIAAAWTLEQIVNVGSLELLLLLLLLQLLVDLVTQHTLERLQGNLSSTGIEHQTSHLGVVVILNLFAGDSGGEGVCVRCELG